MMINNLYCPCPLLSSLRIAGHSGVFSRPRGGTRDLSGLRHAVLGVAKPARIDEPLRRTWLDPSGSLRT